MEIQGSASAVAAAVTVTFYFDLEHAPTKMERERLSRDTCNLITSCDLYGNWRDRQSAKGLDFGLSPIGKISSTGPGAIAGLI